MDGNTLHPILGTDKKNPCFSVFSSADNENDLHIYFGLALLERVNNGPDSFQYKYLLGRLYNAGVKRKKLKEAFGHPCSTLARWGKAVRSGNMEELIRALSGQGAPKELSSEIENFIRTEFRRIYPENGYSYSKEILTRVEEVFGKKFSSERLRPIFNDEKRRLSQIREPDRETENRFPEPVCEDSPSEISESKGCESAADTEGKTENIRKYSLSNFDTAADMPDRFYIHHLGLVLAMKMVNRLNFNEKIVTQWLYSVLCGAVNLEQTGSLDFKALEFLVGQEMISSVYNQRLALGNIATEENRLDILRRNAELVGRAGHTVFYYDPHGVGYTGMRDILKGWCGSRGKIIKVNYQDFIHTLDGAPVYFEIHDNYSDTRERFVNAAGRFTKLFPVSSGRSPTFIIDRAIYGKEIMAEISGRGYGLVTWEKNYRKSDWDEEKIKPRRFRIVRPRNRAEDVKVWDVRFTRDLNWAKIPGFHLLIVRITPPGGKEEAEVGVLTNGTIDDRTAVRAMLNRWIQENDFGYMIRHFGLNQITSYDYYDYTDIKDRLKEKKVFSEMYKQLRKSKTAMESELKKLLLERQKTEFNGKTFKEKKAGKIKTLGENLRRIEKEIKAASGKISKIELMISKGKQRCATEKKALLDAVRITARNIFYLLANKFRPLYNNYRNDHRILRELVQANGFIKYQNGSLVIELLTARNYQPAQRKIIDEFLQTISSEINQNQKEKNPVFIRLSKYTKNGYPNKKIKAI